MDKHISTRTVKEKLQSTGLEHHVSAFCRLLAERLNEEVSPLGFLMAFELLINDLENGNGVTIPGYAGGPPIRTHLSGMPLGIIYRLNLRKIVEHALPEHFAHETMKEWHAVLEDAKGRG